MSVRKRTWKNRNGEIGEAWVVAYTDQNGKRHIKTFRKKKEADDYHGRVAVEVQDGVHTPDHASITVSKAGANWLAACEADKLERATLVEYRRHLVLHIVPFIGSVRLSKLTPAMVSDLRRKLLTGAPAPGEETGKARGAATVRKVMCSLGAILSEAQKDRLVHQNVAKSLGRDRRGKAHQKRRLEVGVDIPSNAEIAAIIGALKPGNRWRPFFLTAIFCGLRASELRGLRWQDVHLDKDTNTGMIHVRQRADRFNKIDAPKSEAGTRSIPLVPIVVEALRNWRPLTGPRLVTTSGPRCPVGALDLVFPNGIGNVESLPNIASRGLWPTQIAAGVSTFKKDADGTIVLDADGKPIKEAKYPGMHALRHWFASWCLNSKAKGGRGLSLKETQSLLGHSSITLTADVYGHLFPRGDDTAELAAAQAALLG
jgi:integrase